MIAIKVKEIAMQCNDIIKKTRPKELEPILKQITDETINGVIISSHEFLDRTKSQIDREIKQNQI